MDNRKNKLINLIEEVLPTLSEIELSELFTHELKLSGGCDFKDLNQINIDELMGNFFSKYQQNSVESTLYNYKRFLTNFINATKNDLNIDGINKYIKSKPWNENTLNRNLIVLKRFLAYCLFEKQYIKNDISQGIRIPKKVRKAQFFASDTQIRDFIDKIKYALKSNYDILKYETIFKLYIKTGMRRNELLSLNVEDIDFNSNKITVRKTKNKEIRIINLDYYLIDLINTYLDYFKFKTGPLFRGKHDKRLCRQVLADVFHVIRNSANIPSGFTIHGFRRYFINTLRKNIKDIVVIQKLVGHKDIRTTEIYCDVEDEEMVKAISTINI